MKKILFVLLMIAIALSSFSCIRSKEVRNINIVMNGVLPSIDNTTTVGKVFSGYEQISESVWSQRLDSQGRVFICIEGKLDNKYVKDIKEAEFSDFPILPEYVEKIKPRVEELEKLKVRFNFSLSIDKSSFKFESFEVITLSSAGIMRVTQGMLETDTNALIDVYSNRDINWESIFTCLFNEKNGWIL